MDVVYDIKVADHNDKYIEVAEEALRAYVILSYACIASWNLVHNYQSNACWPPDGIPSQYFPDP
jgi:hypothetical protein